ncbi:MAG: T9SS type A sorting domain-containing protein, partial [Wenyingzhuangia sp.]
FGFGTSDTVRLFNKDNVLQDEVSYTNELPWSDCADQTGNTLELMTPNLDNALPESWSCTNPNGSPNAKNKSRLSFNEYVTTEVKIYPNPVRDELYISGVSGQFEVQVFTLTGQEVSCDTDTYKVDVHKLKRGMYFIKINKDSDTTLLKFIKY